MIVVVLIVAMTTTGAKASAPVLLVDLHHYSSIGYDTKTDKERIEDPALPPWLSSRTGNPPPCVQHILPPPLRH